MTAGPSAPRPGMVEIGWRRRGEPLAPGAVYARNRTAAALCRAVAARVATGDAPEVYGAGRVVLAIGPAERLPWVDGATWLGWADGVLVPTMLEATPDPVLVARAARRAAPDAGWIVLAPGLRMEGDRAIGTPDAARLLALAAELDAR